MNNEKEKLVEYMLTTIDNPYDPFTQYDEWEAYDKSMGYYTSEYLARIVNTSFDLGPEEICQNINAAIDEILKLNVLGIYRKVKKGDINANTTIEA